MSGARERVANEIVPVSAEQFSTLDDNEEKYGAELAIDLNLETYSQTKDERYSGEKTWLKINLDSVHCVEEVFLINKVGIYRSWTCTTSDCFCKGDRCDDYTLTVSTEGTAPDLSPFFNCNFYGDTMKYERNDGEQTGVYEIAIIAKPGRTTDLYYCPLINLLSEYSSYIMIRCTIHGAISSKL